MKNDQYFRLEANIMANDNVLSLIELMGMEGYGIYISLLGELRQRDDYRCAFNSLAALARRWNTGLEQVRSVVLNFDLFEATSDDLFFSSFYLNQVMRSLDEKRRHGLTVGKSRTVTVQRAADGRFTVARPLEEKSIEEKREEEKKEVPPKLTPRQVRDVVNNVDHWEQYIDEAFGDQSWLEVVAMHSGMGVQFMERLPAIVRFFKQHVRTYGKEQTLCSVADAKSYFGNFVRQHSPTQKALLAELTKQAVRHAAGNPYRYEEHDPLTGQRMYCGLVIPADAPPRPHENAVWSETLREWS